MADESSPPPPPRATSYSREILQRLKRSTWEQRYVLGAVLLGQCLSLCLCGTGVISELLVTDFDISVPTTQCFINYLLLALTFGVYFATRKRFLTVLKYNWWKYIILGVMDVEANFLFTLAYRYTNLTSIQLLDCFTIVVVMVLSYVFLKTRYKLINIMGVLLTMIGIACLVLADLSSPRNNGGSAKFLGDMLCLVGTVIYAASNVSQEYLVKSHSVVEYLGLIGIVGSFVSGAQLIGLEYTRVARIHWTPAVGGLFGGFGVVLFFFYSLTPWVIRMSSAVVFNLSLLTADFYTLLFGLFLFNYNFTGFYLLGFCLVVFGILIYNLKHPVEKKLRERTENERKERSIERLFSVATTKVDSSTEPGHTDWKLRGLLESSVDTSCSSASIGILSQSYQLTTPHYGSTAELKVPSLFPPPRRYDNPYRDPTPFWGGRHDNELNRGNQISLEAEVECDSVRLSQSAPHGTLVEGRGGGEGGVWLSGEGRRRHGSVGGMGGGEGEGEERRLSPRGVSGREGDPEGMEDRNYSRQGGVGEEGEKGRGGEGGEGGGREGGGVGKVQQEIVRGDGEVGRGEDGLGTHQKQIKDSTLPPASHQREDTPSLSPSDKKRPRRHPAVKRGRNFPPQSHRKVVHRDRVLAGEEGEGEREREVHSEKAKLIPAGNKDSSVLEVTREGTL